MHPIKQHWGSARLRGRAVGADPSVAAGGGERGWALAMLRCKLGRRVRPSRVSVSCLGMVGGPCQHPRAGRELGKKMGEKFAPGA